MIDWAKRRDQSRRLVGFSGLLMLLASSGVGAEAPSWRIERGEVQIVVPLKLGGAFTATTPSLRGTLTLGQAPPALLGGEISMDLATIDTGIDLRNQHLRENYLEVAKGEGFARAVLSELQLKDANGEAFVGSTAFTGVLLLHGVKHAVEGKAEIGREGSGRRVRAEFPLVLTDFGIEPPQYLGVGVANKLLVKVRLNALPVHEPGK